MSFQLVPLREIKASGELFCGTYRYVSPSIARPRKALLRRASVGNFEIVEKSADKKQGPSDFGLKSKLPKRNGKPKASADAIKASQSDLSREGRNMLSRVRNLPE